MFAKIIIKLQISGLPTIKIPQCGFRRGFNAQNYLLTMLEKWESSVDKRKTFGALIPELSEAFDCLSHEKSSLK